MDFLISELTTVPWNAQKMESATIVCVSVSLGSQGSTVTL